MQQLSLQSLVEASHSLRESSLQSARFSYDLLSELGCNGFLQLQQ